jgi:hypothetical protein
LEYPGVIGVYLADQLSWLDGISLLETLDTDFMVAATSALASALSPDLASTVNQLSDSSCRRLALAPEMTRRVLFSEATQTATDDFLPCSVAVEAALEGFGAAPSTPSWSALGDVLLKPDGTAAWWPQIPGAMPLDFGSKWANRIDLSGREEFARRPRRSFTAAEIIAVRERMAEALTGLRAASETAMRVAVRATNVLVLQVDPDTPSVVSSGTSGRYIGRSFITNPHLPSAPVESLAEAVLHEAIHGLLYRDQRARAWVSGKAAEEIDRLRSPWTGRVLPIRAFLEACCVWYGLVHLWALALDAGVFVRSVAEQHLGRSVRGFLGASLVDLVKPWDTDIRPDVIEALDALQRRVRVGLGP